MMMMMGDESLLDIDEQCQIGISWTADGLDARPVQLVNDRNLIMR